MRSVIATGNVLLQGFQFLKPIFKPITGIFPMLLISPLSGMKVIGFNIIVNNGSQTWTMQLDPQRSTRLKTGFFSG